MDRASSSEKSSPMPTIPSFFKIMVGYFSETMDIPLPFARTITDLEGSIIYLEDAFGLRWRVWLCLRDGVLHLVMGGRTLCSITTSALASSWQIARSVFTVQIFGISACERMHHCEKNKRQSRKMKPSQKTDYPANNQMVKMWINVERNNAPNRDMIWVPANLNCLFMYVSTSSELRCSESSAKELDVAAGESHEVVEVPKRAANDCTTECNATLLMADKEPARSHQDSPMQLYCALGLEDGNAATEDCEDSKILENAEQRTPLATMDLNEASIDDIFLSADIYEFDSDFCSPEAFSFDLNNEGLATNGQSSDIYFGMPATSTCLENKQMSDVPITSADGGSVTVHGIEINVLPAWPDAYKRVNIFCASLLRATKLQKKQDILEDGPRQTAVEIMPSSPKTSELAELRKNSVQPGNNCEGQEKGRTKSLAILAVAANNKKFCIAVPPLDQTWLELPRRLPVLPKTKKQARKILILKDPSMRLWPVLYQCTPKFNGFITGWADISRENNLHEGDTCVFELCSKTELSFQVVAPNSQ
uniref:TF-B3 domain-containing protein n=1 Tax=Leersia perrieri TaxID=77586 RepID=A0A0D9V984_9ORYZ